MSLSYLAAFLAAIGLDNVLSGSTGARRVIAAVGISLGCVEGLWWIAEHAEVLKSTADVYWLRDWRVLHAVALMAVGSLLVVFFHTTLRRAAAVSLVLILAAEGVFNNSYPSPDSWDIFEHPVPYVEALKRDAGMKRVMPFGALNANLNSPFEIFSFDSLMTINRPGRTNSTGGTRSLRPGFSSGRQRASLRSRDRTAPASGSSRFETRFRTSCSRRNPVDTQRGSRMATCGYSNAQRRLVSSFPVSIGCFARRLS